MLSEAEIIKLLNTLQLRITGYKFLYYSAFIFAVVGLCGGASAPVIASNRIEFTETSIDQFGHEEKAYNDKGLALTILGFFGGIIVAALSFAATEKLYRSLSVYEKMVSYLHVISHQEANLSSSRLTLASP